MRAAPGRPCGPRLMARNSQSIGTTSPSLSKPQSCAENVNFAPTQLGLLLAEPPACSQARICLDAKRVPGALQHEQRTDLS